MIPAVSVSGVSSKGRSISAVMVRLRSSQNAARALIAYGLVHSTDLRLTERETASRTDWRAYLASQSSRF